VGKQSSQNNKLPNVIEASDGAELESE